MGLGDTLKQLTQKGQDLLSKNSDKVGGLVNKGTEFANKQTGGKYQDQINSVGQKAGKFLNNQAGQTGDDASAAGADATGDAGAAATGDAGADATNSDQATDPGPEDTAGQ